MKRKKPRVNKPPVKRKSTLQKEAKMLAEFNRLSGIKDKGVQKYSFDYIIARLSEKFFLAPSTIERILTQLGKG